MRAEASTVQHVLEAFVECAEQVLFGQAHVVEVESSGIGRAHAQLLLELADDEAGRRSIDDERRNASGALTGIGRRHDDVRYRRSTLA